MRIIVEAETLSQIVETIKSLPVGGSYEAANRWVGCVLALEMLINNSEIVEENTEEKPTEG